MGLLDFLFAPIEPGYVTRAKKTRAAARQTGILDPLLGLLGLQPVQPKYMQRRLALLPGPRTPSKPPKGTST